MGRPRGDARGRAVQAVTARAGNVVLLAVGIVNLVVNVVGNIVLSRWFGVAGIALSTVCVYAISATILIGWLRRRLAAAVDRPADG